MQSGCSFVCAQNKLWTDFDEIFRISSYWTNLEKTKFCAPNSPGNGSRKGEEFSIDDMTRMDIAAN